MTPEQYQRVLDVLEITPLTSRMEEALRIIGKRGNYGRWYDSRTGEALFRRGLARRVIEHIDRPTDPDPHEWSTLSESWTWGPWYEGTLDGWLVGRYLNGERVTA